MGPLQRDDYGSILVLVGITLLCSTTVIGILTAPPPATDPAVGSDTVVGLQGGGVSWHQYGSVARLSGSEVVWREASAASYFGVTRMSNGTVLAAFADGDYSNCGPYASPCYRTGVRVIESGPDPRVRDEYSFPVRTMTDSEVHDAEPLPSGGYLIADMEHERLVAVENGTVTWEWSARSFYDAPPDATKTDWLHVNDVDVVGEGRYLVSVRNANQLLVVERGAGVVEVVNEDDSDADDESCTSPGQLVADGDVRCGDPATIEHQHNPQWLGDGAILVADSENDRVVELHRSADGDWHRSWTLDAADGLGFEWPRDADRLPNGNTLVTDTGNRRIVEVTESGDVVRRQYTSRMPYEADRVAIGEPAGAPRYDQNATTTELYGGTVPVLTPALTGLRAVMPPVPYWYHEPHLGATLVAVVLVAVGVALRRYR